MTYSLDWIIIVGVIAMGVAHGMETWRRMRSGDIYRIPGCQSVLAN